MTMLAEGFNRCSNHPFINLRHHLQAVSMLDKLFCLAETAFTHFQTQQDLIELLFLTMQADNGLVMEQKLVFLQGFRQAFLPLLGTQSTGLL